MRSYRNFVRPGYNLKMAVPHHRLSELGGLGVVDGPVDSADFLENPGERIKDQR